VKPRVGISRCLLGDDVRYDGTNKRSSAVITLGQFVEWVPVCPEVDVGMGVPREPIQLVARPDGIPSGRERVILRGVRSNEDWTARMDQWAKERAVAIAAAQISGFVLKACSPSCGPAEVLVHRAGADPTPTGRGLFAEALAAAIPGLPMIDEEALEDAQARAAFIQRVVEFSRLRRSAASARQADSARTNT
jgi:uncharacterized protein YbbK (DUF523 family)